MTFILRYFLDMSGNLVNFYAFVILFKIYMYIYINIRLFNNCRYYRISSYIFIVVYLLQC